MPPGAPPRYAIGSGTVADTGGGIARVGRMSARALLEAGYRIGIFSLLDAGPIEVGGMPVRACRGNKLLFAARALAAAMRCGAVLYDALGVSSLRCPAAATSYGSMVSRFGMA